MNCYQVFVVFVEGPDDGRFAERLLVRILKGVFLDVRVHEYRNDKPSKTDAYIRTIKRVEHWNYLFVADIDDSTCVTSKKEQLVGQYSSLEPERIAIVKYEIESWYLAGLSSEACEEFGVQVPSNTVGLTKEDFNRLVPRSFESRTDFLIEILNRYDSSAARGKNESFNYVMTKHFDLL